MTAPVLEGFERNFLFRLTRFVAMAFILLLMVGIATGGSYAFLSLGQAPSQKVSPNEVVQAIMPPAASSDEEETAHSSPKAAPEVFPSLKMPFVLQKYFDPENMKKLRSWLDEIPENERREYLGEMASAVSAAEKAGLDPIDAINKYRELKTERLNAAKQSSQERMLLIAGFVGSAIAAIISIALFSLVLVMLAVERNTRNTNV